jgi:hypothetical protein
MAEFSIPGAPVALSTRRRNLDSVGTAERSGELRLKKPAGKEKTVEQPGIIVRSYRIYITPLRYFQAPSCSSKRFERHYPHAKLHHYVQRSATAPRTTLVAAALRALLMR